jgi:uncharacterized protein YjbJ (UPF0337 family)
VGDVYQSRDSSHPFLTHSFASLKLKLIKSPENMRECLFSALIYVIVTAERVLLLVNHLITQSVRACGACNSKGVNMGEYNRDSIGEEASALGQRAKGDVKEAAGAITGDRQRERSGAQEAAMGAARQRSNRMVTGLFRDRESAERAYGSLSERGYGKDDVNLLMSDDTRKKYFSDDDDTEFGTKAWEGAGKGAAIGGGVGATLGAIAAIGTTLALPGIGLLVAGPIAAALAGGGAGALTGGLIGALVGHGIPEEHAKHYEQGIREGGIVMGVQPRSDEDADYFEKNWRENRGESIYR